METKFFNWKQFEKYDILKGKCGTLLFRGVLSTSLANFFKTEDIHRPLLARIMLNDFSQKLKKPGVVTHRLVRLSVRKSKSIKPARSSLQHIRWFTLPPSSKTPRIYSENEKYKPIYLNLYFPH